MTEQVFIATLGSEPQVVTLALDLLIEQGYSIRRAIVVHTSGKAVQEALRTLSVELGSSQSVLLEKVAVTQDKRPVADILTHEDVRAFLRAIYRVLLKEKRAGRVVHLSIAGERKTLAVYAMAAAQILFDEEDHVWHLLTEGWMPGHERIMHVRPGDKINLIPVPVLRWSSVSPVLTELALREDPWEAIQAQKGMKQEEDLRRKREFLDHWLTPAEREVVRLACQGLDNAAIARQLRKSEKTVANQFTSIYDKLYEWRGFRDDIPVSRAVLVAEFAPYFSRGQPSHSFSPGARISIVPSPLRGRGQEPAPYLIWG